MYSLEETAPRIRARSDYRGQGFWAIDPVTIELRACRIEFGPSSARCNVSVLDHVGLQTLEGAVMKAFNLSFVSKSFFDPRRSREALD
jgi:hypothetical protein